MPPRLLLGFIALVLTLPACADYPTLYAATASARATREFSCPADKIHEKALAVNAFQVTGCGYEATYFCSVQKGAWENHFVCLREGNVMHE